MIRIRPITGCKFDNGRLAGLHQHNTVNKGVDNFRTTASAPYKKPGARVRTVRTTDNMKGAGSAVGRTPDKSYADIQFPSAYWADRFIGCLILPYVITPTEHKLCKFGQIVNLLEETRFVSDFFQMLFVA